MKICEWGHFTGSHTTTLYLARPPFKVLTTCFSFMIIRSIIGFFQKIYPLDRVGWTVGYCGIRADVNLLSRYEVATGWCPDWLGMCRVLTTKLSDYHRKRPPTPPTFPSMKVCLGQALSQLYPSSILSSLVQSTGCSSDEIMSSIMVQQGDRLFSLRW